MKFKGFSILVAAIVLFAATNVTAGLFTKEIAVRTANQIIESSVKNLGLENTAAKTFTGRASTILGYQSTAMAIGALNPEAMASNDVNMMVIEQPELSFFVGTLEAKIPQVAELGESGFLHINTVRGQMVKEIEGLFNYMRSTNPEISVETLALELWSMSSELPMNAIKMHAETFGAAQQLEAVNASVVSLHEIAYLEEAAMNTKLYAAAQTMREAIAAEMDQVGSVPLGDVFGMSGFDMNPGMFGFSRSSYSARQIEAVGDIADVFSRIRTISGNLNHAFAAPARVLAKADNFSGYASRVRMGAHNLNRIYSIIGSESPIVIEQVQRRPLDYAKYLIRKFAGKVHTIVSPGILAGEKIPF